ncbi:hypothetical protein SAMN05444370_13116 [Rubrimonas cliftonensis]|uniref:Uncharacterized protein n=2 Tax=Rubrimonas cliftonensis TaxID=89524 RepID=A0A1H4FY53_9RHOB|nr:hypothetical protein SAMN05444370_13116 [Rubrimonas cliftonensis]
MQHTQLVVCQDPKATLIEEFRSAVDAGRVWAARAAAEMPQQHMADDAAKALGEFAARASTRDLLDEAAPTEARCLAGALKQVAASLSDDPSDAAYMACALLREHAEALTALADKIDAAFDLHRAIVTAAKIS